MNFQMNHLGDQAIMVEFGQSIDLQTYASVQRLADLLDQHEPVWLIEYVQAYTTVTVHYDPLTVLPHAHSPSAYIMGEIEAMLQNQTATAFKPKRKLKIPVCYGGEYGPDLSYVASYHGLTEDEVIKLHTKEAYTVYMLGFAPGFPYLGGMDRQIATPRKEKPRLRIPARSVGIAGEQTGIYPLETPGGWQLIGRSPLAFFQTDEQNPTLLRAGDEIRFIAICENQFKRMEHENK